MVIYVNSGSLFDAEVDALVNPVNCVGTMGKGLAKEFATLYPECIEPYQRACDEKALKPGSLMLVKLIIRASFDVPSHPAILLFATKDHWRGKSKLEWIESGFINLKEQYQPWNLQSVAMPKVGCGLGGLEWVEVKSLLETHFQKSTLRLLVY